MVRAPCCEKMGLKKGPWTPEEDQILISHIERYGHSNWRALPKQAGLLRCGKSCRLRWINYLRPDIKRGNFTREEEETILKLHEMLGNRWSAIAAKLPGRTDNEIKNVWHTHLKKRLLTKDTNQNSNIKIKAKSMKRNRDIDSRPISPAQSPSDFSSSVTETSSGENTDSYGTSFVKEESFTSEEFPIIDESFWSEDVSMDNGNELNYTVPADASFDAFISEPAGMLCSSNGDDMDFWLRVFIEAGEMNDLPQI
ncbi:hypothetical protein LUZ63_001787 [Rhynchospora breviuscula]|uniref:Uncharacterized protein n=1 Tax=Rhynchospora breviuscula TaxID=2022672 RepID=A0A9Q0CXI5_9POAL|nr:hypothetical protein LUZ63_001787 [Rhynchospora breviuscula]